MQAVKECCGTSQDQQKGTPCTALLWVMEEGAGGGGGEGVHAEAVLCTMYYVSAHCVATLLGGHRAWCCIVCGLHGMQSKLPWCRCKTCLGLWSGCWASWTSARTL